MFIARLGRHFREQDWFAVVVEVLVVIVGLMLAFQLDRWREQQIDRQDEHAYIDRLIVDIEEDIPTIETAIEIAELRLEFVNKLMAVAVDPRTALDQPAVFLAAVNQASFTFAPSLTRHTFDDLRTTGNMRLIRDSDIKDALFDYYGWEESQRQFRPIQISVEFRHFELAAGVLTHAQENYIQDHWLVVGRRNIDELRNAEPDLAQVLAAAERFSERAELVAWLPQLRQLHKERILVSTALIERARVLVEILRKYSAGVSGTL